MVIFKDSINSTHLKNYDAELLDLIGKEAIQVLLPGTGAKVIVTQEYFFHLLATHNTVFPPDEKTRHPESLRENAKARVKALLKEQSETLKLNNK